MKSLIQQERTPLPVVGVVALVLISLGFLAGRISAPPSEALTSSGARLVATPTPRLMLQTPRVLASFLTPNNTHCGSCYTINFAGDGPFDLISSCQPVGAFADSLLTYTLQLYDGNGHLVDTIQQLCGDPNTSTVTTHVVPENLPEGNYTLKVDNAGGETHVAYGLPVSVLILDAAQHTG